MQFQCQFTQISCLVADSRKRSRGLSARVPQSGTLALSSVWHLALWHSALFGTWHFGTQLCLALGTLALSSVWHLALWHSALFGTDETSGTWHSIGRNSVIAKRRSAIRRAPANYLYG